MNALFEAGGGGGADDDLGGMDYVPGYDDDDDDGPAHFATQFLAADDDDDDEAQYFGEGALPSSSGAEPLSTASASAGGPNDDSSNNDDDGGVGAAASQAVLRVRPEHVSYAKKAKRIDVKKLKENIWTTLERNAIVVPDLPAETVYSPTTTTAAGGVEVESADQGAAETTTKEAMVPVIESLRSTYPKDKMDEISTSFCFICLLHLANEKGLRIQVPLSKSPAAESAKDRESVARFEQLRVLRAASSSS